MVLNSKGRLYIISAPSGAGKTTLCNMLMKKYPAIQYSISYTTRAPRGNEQNGKEYFFIDEDKFKTMISEEIFLEWAQVHGNYYGTSKQQIENALNNGTDIINEEDKSISLGLLSAFDIELFTLLLTFTLL